MSSLPAVRSLVALPGCVRAHMASFLEFVQGVPQSEELQRELMAEDHDLSSENWGLHHRRVHRSARVDGKKVILRHEFDLEIYAPNATLPLSIRKRMEHNPNLYTEEELRRFRMRHFWGTACTDADFFEVLSEVREKVRRLEHGEICANCRLSFPAPGSDRCQRCLFAAYFGVVRKLPGRE